MVLPGGGRAHARSPLFRHGRQRKDRRWSGKAWFGSSGGRGVERSGRSRDGIARVDWQSRTCWAVHGSAGQVTDGQAGLGAYEKGVDRTGRLGKSVRGGHDKELTGKAGDEGDGWASLGRDVQGPAWTDMDRQSRLGLVGRDRASRQGSHGTVGKATLGP